MSHTEVYQALKLIPKGKVVTYKILAEFTGIKNPRVAGNILHKNTLPEEFPCHRVVKSDGSIASGYAMGGPTEQARKLKEEGVIFLSSNNSGRLKVDLTKSLFILTK